MANPVHRKTYRLGDLISPRGDLERRCRRIEAFTSTSGPEVRFEFTDDVLIRTSPHLTGAGSLRETLPGQRQQLASLIDAAHANKLVHGDIGLKNLVLSQGKVHLVDWEPCLRQLIGGEIRFLVSPPCHHPADRRSSSVTILTDLMGLALLWPAQTALSASRLATAALNENRESPAAALALALDQQRE
ncbi:MAG: hypothetical protein ACO33A_00615 [Hyphomonas sp.]